MDIGGFHVLAYLDLARYFGSVVIACSLYQ